MDRIVRYLLRLLGDQESPRASRDWPPRPASVTEALTMLARATEYAEVGEMIGVAAQAPETDGARLLLRAAGSAAVPGAWRLLTHASPAGRVHAARLLGEIDPTVGRAAWRRLAKDRSRLVFNAGGCDGYTETTVGEMARLALDPAFPDDFVEAYGRRYYGWPADR